MNNKKNKIESILRRRVMILDGATGTELQKAGLPQGVSPEVWSMQNPEIVKNVHALYCKTGVDAIHTCTFGANHIKLSQYGKYSTFQVNRKLAKFAREVAKDSCLVAGDIGPTGRFVSPLGDLEFDEAVRIYKEQVRGLLAGGVDFFLIETMIDIQEARAALLAVKELSTLFTCVTMTFEKGARTLNGTDPLAALITLQSLGADAVGCNCSTGPLEMLTIISQMKKYSHIPLIAKPNAGIPRIQQGKTVFPMGAQEFGQAGKLLVDQGVVMIGGCCGTTPEHIFQLKRQLKNVPRGRPRKMNVSVVSSATKAVVLDSSAVPVVVGERINPTGKKILQNELVRGEMSMVRKIVKEQESQGAVLLDINVGMPQLDERTLMLQVLQCVCTVTDLPLIIDSSDPAVIESALRYYPGRAIINSISAEPKKMRKLLKIAARYGAMIILLPVEKKGIPSSVERRIDIIKRLYNHAKEYGFTKEDIIVDALAMAVSSQPDAAKKSLALIQWCAQRFGVNSIVGLSNISYGLPRRKLLNSAFLTMAQAYGLSMSIMNPSAQESMSMKYAADVMTGKDKGMRQYLRFCSQTQGFLSEKGEGRKHSAHESVFEAVLLGDRDGIIKLLDQKIKSHTKAEEIVRGSLIPAIRKVGDLFEQKKYFLPQLIASAETFQRAFAYLRKYLSSEVSPQNKGVIILATVKGDIHDIGKNIVSLMLQNSGFTVVDLGKDVSTRQIIRNAMRVKASVIGLSALMTTTMIQMKEMITGIRNEGIKAQFIVGGAVVTQKFADSIGAAYAKNGLAAVKEVSRLIKRRSFPKGKNQ